MSVAASESVESRCEPEPAPATSALRWVVAVAHGFVLLLAAQALAICVSCLPHWHGGFLAPTLGALMLFWAARMNPVGPIVVLWLGSGIHPALCLPILGFLAFRLTRSKPRAFVSVAATLLLFLGNATVEGPDDEPLRPRSTAIVCLGDSSAFGVFVRQSWCDMLGGTKAAAPGADADDVLAQWERVKGFDPRWVIVQVGANQRWVPRPGPDLDVNERDRRAALSRCFETLTREADAWGGRVLVIDYPVSRWPEPSWVRDVRDAVPAGASLVAPHLRWWEIAADHLHPTYQGHLRIAEALRRVIDSR